MRTPEQSAWPPHSWLWPAWPTPAVRIAVLLTGQAFRTPKARSTEDSRSCANESYSAQHAATHSLLKNVVHPLEQRGARVDIFFTFPACGRSTVGAPLLGALHGWLGSRVVNWRIVRNRDVGHSWQQAYALLQCCLNTYDAVFSVRHDLLLSVPLPAWHVDLSSLLFLAEQGGTVRVDCSSSSSTSCRAKANDKLLWVPRRKLRAVLREVESPSGLATPFNPHYLIERFLRVPPAALDRRYEGHALLNGTCEGYDARSVPPELRARFAPGVGLLRSCAAAFYRFAPDRGWT